MKSFVITITDLDRSVEISNRCIKSGAQFGVQVEVFKATTPKDDIFAIAKSERINFSAFDETYSRKDNAISCFISHYQLWKQCAEINEEFLILEHDAVFIAPIEKFNFNKLVSIGKPSYGKFRIPQQGVGPLTSKDYLPGAHAYIIKPNAAKELINKSRIKAEPVDIFINRKSFPWIQEYYPWPIEVKDTFTTVQKTAGCIAKHSYNQGFEIL